MTEPPVNDQTRTVTRIMHAALLEAGYATTISENQAGVTHSNVPACVGYKAVVLARNAVGFPLECFAEWVAHNRRRGALILACDQCNCEVAS